jgi:hypothetical protein
MLSGPPVTGSLGADQLLDRFLTGSARQRRPLVGQLERRCGELLPLIPARLAGLDAEGDDWAAGCLIQLLWRNGNHAARQELTQTYPDGWLSTPSDTDLTYDRLQGHLVAEEFQAADRLTSAHLRQLAGPAAEARGYVYYSEVKAMPALDLESIDRLWICYSRGRFGFSVQARLLGLVNGQWERLWPRLGWKSDGVWTRYPHAFTWSLEAPEGHMPLINQLRGVRLMDALLRHPAIRRRSEAKTS